jgi:hypothetical protein
VYYTAPAATLEPYAQSVHQEAEAQPAPAATLEPYAQSVHQEAEAQPASDATLEHNASEEGQDHPDGDGSSTVAHCCLYQTGASPSCHPNLHSVGGNTSFSICFLLCANPSLWRKMS